VNGKQISFKAPCPCTETEGLQIDGVQYTVVDSFGACVTGIGGRWDTGAIVSVILDVDHHRAFLQNESSPFGAFNEYTGSLDADKIPDGCYSLSVYSDSSCPIDKFCGTFLQFTGVYKSQMLIGSASGASTQRILVRRYFTSSNSFSEWMEPPPSTRTINGKALSADISLTASDVGAIPLTRGAYSSLGVARLKDVRTPGSYRIAVSSTGTLPTDWPDEFKDVKYGFWVLTVEQGDSYLVQELTTVATDVEGFTRKATRMLTEKKDSPWIVTMMNNGQVQITTYEGTGGVGVDAPTEVTFNFVPKIVFVTASSPDNKCRQVTTFIHGISNVKGWYSEDINGGRLTATWDDENKKLSWYARGTWSYDGNDPELTAGYQLNAAQYVYTVVAMA
jgi:hypothetical protein